MSRQPASRFVIGLAALVLCLGTGSSAAVNAGAFQGSILYEGGAADGVYAADATGKLKLLVADAYEAHWSPDGTKLAFLRTSPDPVLTGPFGRSDLYVTGSDGRHLRLVTRTDIPDAYGPNFSWSPDSNALAFRDTVNQDGVIASIGIDGRHRRRVGLGVDPAWSPGGARIAFLDGGELWVANPDGTVERELTSGALGRGPISWSPDGKHLAFGTCCPGVGVRIVTSDGGRMRTLQRAGSASWSPNGRWLALHGGRGTELIRADGSGRRLISSLGSLDPFVPPVWSPDSRGLAVESPLAGTCCTTDIWVLPLGGRARRVTQGFRYGYGSYQPEWQPQSLSLARISGTYVSPAIPNDSIIKDGELWAPHPIDKLAASGSRVAVDYIGGQLEVWDSTTGALTAFLGSCYSGLSKGCVSLALVGDRVAWARTETRASTIVTATTSIPRIQNACFTATHCGALDGAGIDDLTADGTTIAFDSWAAPCRLSVYDPPCVPKTAGTLWRLNGTRAVQIAADPGPMTVRSVDAGRILVDHENGTLDIRDLDGALLRSFSLNAALLKGARLQGNDLVVQTPTAIEITNAETGVFQRRWPLPAPDATLTGLQDGIAVLVAGTDIHLLRLSDGHDAVIHTPGQGHVLAQLEPAGLYYSYTTDDTTYRGRVVFVPHDRLPLH